MKWCGLIPFEILGGVNPPQISNGIDPHDFTRCYDYDSTFYHNSYLLTNQLRGDFGRPNRFTKGTKKMQRLKNPSIKEALEARNFELLILRKKPLTYWKFLCLKLREKLQMRTNRIKDVPRGTRPTEKI